MSKTADTGTLCEGVQEQDIEADDIGAIWIKLTQGDSVMQGPTSLNVRE